MKLNAQVQVEPAEHGHVEGGTKRANQPLNFRLVAASDHNVIHVNDEENGEITIAEYVQAWIVDSSSETNLMKK